MTEQTAVLAGQRVARLREALQDAPFDAFLAVSTANVLYATGYRSMGGSVFGLPTIGAFVTGDRTVVAGPVADAAPATDAAVGGIAVDDFVPYGRFYFESDRPLPLAFTPDAHRDAVEAMAAAALSAGIGSAVIGVDSAAINPNALAQLSLALPGARFVDASPWALRVRARKLPGEIALLERAAHLAEDGVDAAISAARVGMTERELSSIVAGVIVAGGGEPKFAVSSSGPHSAFADVYPTDRPLAPGDLLRFDVGCVVGGYWSDIGRTAVVGEPDALQASRYAAILAGEDRQLADVRAGVPASTLFKAAIQEVEAGGIRPYRRQHCGHGIGADVYEPPIVNEATDTAVEAGMTFCFETPYYVVGWGGMMVEDTIVVTDDGHRRLTRTDRSLRVIAV
ncbi:Xaa-Pro peptidase family protein [Dactylosporangium darangshiense]|uniref:Xaa-Pro peptidase family protein n=1 Tax=Dactylosporangium darangshiense TaxID=579108 RepID=UPI0031EA72A3